jgi:hypothetical protein
MQGGSAASSSSGAGAAIEDASRGSASRLEAVSACSSSFGLGSGWSPTAWATTSFAMWLLSLPAGGHSVA